ncbi:MAG: galactitol-1-phosphate 5-dehydrogenase [Verrucomicrobiota bacterium]
MKALLLKEYRRLELVEFPEPVIGPEDLLVRVRACGICGSDVHGYDGSTGRRIPPLIMGHEAAGEVVQTGSAVTRFKAGDRITFDSTIYCGRCIYCTRGQVNLCEQRRVLGVSCGDYRQHGAFAEYVAVPERIAYRLPEAVGYEQAAMIEPVSIAFHAVHRTPIRLGDTAVVIGSGMIGLLVIQALRLAGCGSVIAVDLDEKKLALARQLGAAVTLNAKACEVAKDVQRLTGGLGADVAVEAVGATAPIQTAIASLRKGGALTLVGNLSPKIEFPLQAVVTRELTLNGSCASCGEYPACLDMLAQNRVKVEPLISGRATLEETPAWFERLYAQEPGLMKVIVKP